MAPSPLEEDRGGRAAKAAVDRVRPLWAVAILWAVAMGLPARAQDFDDEEPEPGAVPEVQIGRPVYTDENFDQWVFGGGKTPASARSGLDAIAALRVDQLDLACRLTDAQKAKLRLAARGDVKRFFDLFDEKKRKFQALKDDQNKIQEVFQEIQPLQRALGSGGPFADDSIFAKTIRKTLDPAQVARYDTILREKRAYRYRARVELVIGVLDNTIGFTSDQRKRLANAIVEQTRPPRMSAEQYDYQIVLLQASKIPEAKLRPIVDDAQWPRLKQQLDQAKGMEQFLKQNEYIPDDDAKPDEAGGEKKPLAEGANL